MCTSIDINKTWIYIYIYIYKHAHRVFESVVLADVVTPPASHGASPVMHLLRWSHHSM